MWSSLSMYWSSSEIRNLPRETSSDATSDSSEVLASSSLSDRENATSCTVAGAKHSRKRRTIMSMDLLLSSGGYSTLENDHLLRPSMPVRATRYMDSSLRMALNATSSLISSFSTTSLWGVSTPIASSTCCSMSLSVLSRRVAAA